MGFIKMNEDCYKCGKAGCARATDNNRQFYCFRFRETYFMNNLKGQGGSIGKKNEKKRDKFHDGFNLFPFFNSNHYEDE